MAIWERFGSRDGQEDLSKSNASRRTLRFIVDGTNNDATVDNTVATSSVVPVFFAGLVRNSWDKLQIGPGLWEVDVDYIDPKREDAEEQPDTGDGRFSFDTTGGLVHITQNKDGKTTSYAAAGVTAPDFKGAIGVTDDTVEGVDQVIPALKFSLTYRLPQTQITLPYVLTLRDLTGKSNDANFKGFKQNELLFLGAVGEERTNGDPEIQFFFESSENLQNIVLGGGITVAEKKGHDYLWVHYRTEEDATAKRIVQRPLAAYVEELVEEDDFSKLGIGT